MSLVPPEFRAAAGQPRAWPGLVGEIERRRFFPTLVAAVEAFGARIGG